MITLIDRDNPLMGRAILLQEKTSQTSWFLVHSAPDFAAALSGQAQALWQWRETLAMSLDATDIAASQEFMVKWRQLGLASCNYLRESTLADTAYQLILIDSQCSDTLFSHMLEQASEQPEPIVCLAANSPDDQLRLQQLAQQADALPACQVLHSRLHFQPACHTARLMRSASRVFCSRSLLAVEALIWQKPLICLQDSPFATTELSQGPFSQQTMPKCSLAQFVFYAVLKGTQAVHPERQASCHIAELMEWAALQHQMRRMLPSIVYAYGFSRLWRNTLKRFVQGSDIVFLAKNTPLPKVGTLLVWGRRALPSVHAGLSLVRLEDGFIRSVGLGAEFAHPMSWIVDQQGLYFDATQPSDLEQLLQELTLTESQRQRAEVLQQRICQQGVTKYNVGAQAWQRPDTDKKILLVPGQVETDASIEFGAHRVRNNLQLLQQVRKQNPDAWVIYKPHPDVYSGARAKGQGEDDAVNYCDELVLDVSMAVVLEQVDEVHVMTSLTGFEALLRGKKVVCYGWPFYAGWGLTDDTRPPPRRGRKLDLATLVYATLIAYPRYISDVTGGFSSPEQVLAELECRRQQPISRSDKVLLITRKGMRWCLNLLFGKK